MENSQMDYESSDSIKRNFKNPNKAGRKCVICGAKPIDCPERKFHSFPKNPSLSEKWAEIVGRTDIVNASSSQRNVRYRICSNHFADSDYASKSKLRFIGNAVPKLNLSTSMIKVDVRKMKSKINNLMSPENVALFNRSGSLLWDMRRIISCEKGLLFLLVTFGFSVSKKTSIRRLMLGCTETGKIEKTIRKTHEEAHVEWRISDFSTIAELNDVGIGYDSPAFFINEVSWFLRLFPRSALNPESMRLYIKSRVKREYSVEYNVSLKKSDGSTQQLVNGILKEDTTSQDVGNFIRRSELLQRKSELVSQNALTIICTLKYEIVHSTQPIASDLTPPLTLIRLDTLSKNFKDFFADKEACDTTLKVKDKEFKAHRSVLIARSTVFAATFKHTSEKQTRIITITDCDPDSFPQFLEYLYCARLENLSYRSAINLYYTSDKYDVEELKVFCVEYLMQCLTVENICEVVVFADKYDVTKLSSGTQEYFNKNVCEILETSEWGNLLISNHRLANELLKEMSRVKLKSYVPKFQFFSK